MYQKPFSNHFSLCLWNFQSDPSGWLFRQTREEWKLEIRFQFSKPLRRKTFLFLGGFGRVAKRGRLWWPCCVCLKCVNGWGWGEVAKTERKKDLRDEFQFLSGATKTSYLLNRSHLFSPKIHFRLGALCIPLPSPSWYTPTPVKPAK